MDSLWDEWIGRRPGRSAFADSYAKIKRAEELIRELHRDIRAFEDFRSLAFESELDPNPPKQGANLIRVRSNDTHLFATRMEHFGILAGEVVHHLRSALNHLVWNLIRRENQIPNTRAEFPIFDSEEEYRAGARRKLKGVPPRSLDLFLSVQPFNGDGHADPLWHVHTLDIKDKHHVLLVTTGVLPVRFEQEGESPKDKFFDLADGEAIKGIWTHDPAGTRIDAPIIIALAEEADDRIALETQLLACLQGTESVINTFREIL